MAVNLNLITLSSLKYNTRYIPLVQNIMNTAIHSATGFSPSHMIFGNLSNTTRGLIYPHAIAPPERFSTTSYVQELQQNLVAAAALLHKRHEAHAYQTFFKAHFL